MRPRIFLTTLFLSLTLSGATSLAGGFEGNGGNNITPEFTQLTQNLSAMLKTQSLGPVFPTVNPEAFAAAVDSANLIVEVRDTLTLNGQIAEALNFPSSQTGQKNRIQINRSTWPALSTTRKYLLAFHEVLGLIGVDDVNNHLSLALGRIPEDLLTSAATGWWSGYNYAEPCGAATLHEAKADCARKLGRWANFTTSHGDVWSIVTSPALTFLEPGTKGTIWARGSVQEFLVYRSWGLKRIEITSVDCLGGLKPVRTAELRSGLRKGLAEVPTMPRLSFVLQDHKYEMYTRDIFELAANRFVTALASESGQRHAWIGVGDSGGNFLGRTSTEFLVCRQELE